LTGVSRHGKFWRAAALGRCCCSPIYVQTIGIIELDLLKTGGWICESCPT
jgi:hypothetical protein